MRRIDRVSVDADRRAIAFVHKAAQAIVARFAERSKFAEHERIPVALMRRVMIRDRRGCDRRPRDRAQSGSIRNWCFARVRQRCSEYQDLHGRVCADARLRGCMTIRIALLGTGGERQAVRRGTARLSPGCRPRPIGPNQQPFGLQSQTSVPQLSQCRRHQSADGRLGHRREQAARPHASGAAMTARRKTGRPRIEERQLTNEARKPWLKLEMSRRPGTAARQRNELRPGDDPGPFRLRATCPPRSFTDSSPMAVRKIWQTAHRRLKDRHLHSHRSGYFPSFSSKVFCQEQFNKSVQELSNFTHIVIISSTMTPNCSCQLSLCSPINPQSLGFQTCERGGAPESDQINIQWIRSRPANRCIRPQVIVRQYEMRISSVSVVSHSFLPKYLLTSLISSIVTSESSPSYFFNNFR